MKVIFDHNVPKRLRPFMTGHDVSTAYEMGWAELDNGELLKMAENAGFDVMVTGDKNLSYQQNLKGRKLALIILGTNDWNLLKKNLKPIWEAVEQAEPGGFEVVPEGTFYD